ncbi:MAG: hypothetical protein RMK29_19855 [Myxococcales bacterium]|nr:hypothetical protein [Myxococcota bacterium]MDW8283964.1 hypothetical protein [Myxococcales bacterium]
MRLRLDVPASWERRGDRFYVPGGGEGVLYHPVPTPQDPVAWLRGLLGAGTDDQVQVGAIDTELGWPALRGQVQLSTAVGHEVRIGAVYFLLDFVAAVVITGLQPGRLPELEPSVGAVLASARPDWRGPQVVALVDIWEPEGMIE